MALKELDTVLLKAKTSVNAFAENVYDAEVEVTARWNDITNLVTDSNGIDFKSNSSLYYINPAKFKVGDSVKLNGSSDDFRMIRSIEKYRNGSGTRSFNIAYLEGGFNVNR